MFAQSKVNWDEHLPLLINFWDTMIFRSNAYHGAPLQKHLDLDVTKEHFERWVMIFCETVDARFIGPIAEQMKNAARSIAHTFQLRMGLLRGFI